MECANPEYECGCERENESCNESCNNNNNNDNCNCNNNCGNRCASITGKVKCVHCCSLLLCVCGTGQEVLVKTPNAHCYHCGECLCVHYNGIMSRSNPPQITACCITRVNSCC